MANRRKCRLDRVGRPDMNPMLCRKVIECQERLPVLQKTLRGFWVFGLVGFKKRVKRVLGVFSPFRHPDLMKAFLGLLLKRVRKVVENIGRLMNPTPLMRRLRKDFFQGPPEPHGSIPDRKFGGGKIPFLQIQKNILKACD